MKRQISLMLLAAALIGALSACSFNVHVGSTRTLSKAQLEKVVTQKLTETVGQAPDSVVCPADGLRAEAGATLTCVLTAGPDQIDVLLTAKDDEGNFDIKVAETPHPRSS